jgi:hypothetical protein
MENKEQQILSEIKSMMASIRSQLERLDAKMAELQQVVDPEDLDASPIDIDIDLDDVQVVEVQEIPMEVEEEPVEAPVETPVETPVEEEPEVEEAEVEEEPVVEEETEEETEVEAEAEPEVEEEPEPEVEPVVEEVPVEEEPVEDESEIDDDLPFAETPVEEVPVEEVPVEEVPVEAPVEEDDDDLPGVFDIPVAPVTVAAKAADQARPILNEVMAADCAWRKDMPGSTVRDIRSAISLNDRVIFINLLFKEDAQTFVDTLSKINTMETLDQVVEYICAEFPSWDLNSDLVYRFMMAVRRKVK